MERSGTVLPVSMAVTEDYQTGKIRLIALQNTDLQWPNEMSYKTASALGQTRNPHGCFSFQFSKLCDANIPIKELSTGQISSLTP